MSQQDAGAWIRDKHGNPSRWIALALAIAFAAATVAAALLGVSDHATLILGGSFIVCFNQSFGRQSVIAQMASVFTRLR